MEDYRHRGSMSSTASEKGGIYEEMKNDESEETGDTGVGQ